jgi:hypothetical protein
VPVRVLRRVWLRGPEAYHRARTNPCERSSPMSPLNGDSDCCSRAWRPSDARTRSRNGSRSLWRHLYLAFCWHLWYCPLLVMAFSSVSYVSYWWPHSDFPLEETMTDFHIDVTTLMRQHPPGPSGIAMAREWTSQATRGLVLPLHGLNKGVPTARPAFCSSLSYKPQQTPSYTHQPQNMSHLREITKDGPPVSVIGDLRP